LTQARHNQRRAAELLGLTYDQLRGYLRKYNLLKSPRERSAEEAGDR
jgi:psp operon transcriptional activator